MYVYWIKRKCHQDIRTEGYVGISTEPNRRFEEHSLGKRKTRITAAFKKYDDIEMKIIFEGTEEICKFLEHKFRPEQEIGWNIAAGGSRPPITKPYKSSNPERCEKIRKGLQGNKNWVFRNYRHPPETINMIAQQKAKAKWWQNGVISKFCEECPPGFKPGRISWKTKKE